MQPTDPGTENGESKEATPTAEADATPEKTPEIPPEVQVRLRKLDKLEPKYTGRCEHA